MKTKSAVCAAIIAALLTGCGGEDSKSESLEPEHPGSSVSTTPTATPDAADVAIAEAAVLTLSDFPAGWEAKPADDDDDEKAQHRIADCVGVDYEDLYAGEAQASADSKTFVSENDDEISNSVAITANEARATSVFAIISSEKYRECALEEVKATFEENAKDEDEFKIDDVELNEVSFDQFGDETTAFRITASVQAQGISVDVTLDYVIVRVGRAATTVTAQSSFTPFGADELSKYVKVATDRLSAELA